MVCCGVGLENHIENSIVYNFQIKCIINRQVQQMRKRCNFEENTIHNFEIEEEFDQIMQIQGLANKLTQKRELYVSIKHLFRPQTAVNIIGDGPNANIKSFYYLLLCHIRKEHYKKLVTDFKQKEFENESQEEEVACRDRRVSFNDKRALFINGPQYQNYCLHKLKIFAFSRETDLTIIKKPPFDTETTLRYKGEKLNGMMMKKLLSEFLKELLPQALHQSYKDDIRSVKYHLNKHKSIGIIFTILMRYILLSKYDIESARNFNEEVNDHTVCTTLCDAFAIDGLLCKDNLYEINTWCKVHSIEQNAKKTFFIEMFNDEFQELGTLNQRRNSIINRKTIEKEPTFADNLLSSEQQAKSAAFGYKESVVSSSIMGEDEDSEVASSSSSSSSSSASGPNWRKVENNINVAESQEFRSIGQRQNEQSSHFRDTFNSNKKSVQQIVLSELQKEEDRPSYQHEESSQQSITKQNQPLNFPKILEQQAKQEEPRQRARASLKKSEQQQSLFQSQSSAKSKGIRVIKIGYRDQGQANIVNNNISNNIYVNLGGDSGKPYPVINISTTKESDASSDSYIKINLS